MDHLEGVKHKSNRHVIFLTVPSCHMPRQSDHRVFHLKGRRAEIHLTSVNGVTLHDQRTSTIVDVDVFFQLENRLFKKTKVPAGKLKNLDTAAKVFLQCKVVNFDRPESWKRLINFGELKLQRIWSGVINSTLLISPRLTWILTRWLRKHRLFQFERKDSRKRKNLPGWTFQSLV